MERCHVLVTMTWAPFTGVAEVTSLNPGALPGKAQLLVSEFPESRGDGLSSGVLSIDAHPGQASALPRNFCVK